MMIRRSSFLFVGLLVLGACSSADDGEAAAETEAPAPAPAATDDAMSMAAADTTGAAVWAHIQESDYQAWPRWPGLGDQYAGQEPHGMLLTTYVNDVALAALESGATTMPAGAVIIKDNYMPDGTLAAVTTMLKVPGYNADAGDWFWTKHLPDGTLDAAPNGMALEGRLPGCIGCHTTAVSTDYLVNAQGN